MGSVDLNLPIARDALLAEGSVTAAGNPQRHAGEAHAHKLRAAGVAMTLSRYPGLIHGFFQMAGALPAGAQLIEECAASLRMATATNWPPLIG